MISYQSQSSPREVNPPDAVSAQLASFQRLSQWLHAKAETHPSLRTVDHLIRSACEVFFDLTAQLAAAEESELVATVQRERGLLDRFLATPADQMIGPALAQAFDGNYRAADLVQNFLSGYEAARSEALRQLGERGLRRLRITAGWSLYGRGVRPSNEPPLPTSNPDWHDRAALVQPGKGGWEFNGELVVPAVARRFVYQPDAADEPLSDVAT